MALHYSAAGMDLEKIQATGKASCEGGQNPSPSLHHYPLLAWTHTGHPDHGEEVFTEDQQVSVGDVARAVAETPSIPALAARFNTSENHIIQALDYAIEAGCLKATV